MTDTKSKRKGGVDKEQEGKAKSQKNDTAKTIQRLDVQVAKCKLGSAWINLLTTTHNLEVGRYNDRPEVELETSKLIASFKTSGIVSMKNSSAIPIIIDKSGIENNFEFALGFDDPEAVPHLELNEHSDIIVASGQHRISAVKRYRGLIEEEMESYQTRRGKLADLKTLTDEAINEHNALGDQIAECMGQLDGMGKWGVIVYDKSKLLANGDELANHLSRNNALHEYSETQEEVLIAMLKSIQPTYLANPDDFRQCDAAVTLTEELRAKMDKNSRLQKVMRSPNMCMMLSHCLLPMGHHFRRRREFSVTWLSKSMGICMGVYIFRIFNLDGLLRKLCSRDAFPNYAHVRKLVNKADGDSQEKQNAVAELQDLRVLLENSTPNHGGGYLWAGVMDDLDRHARTAFEERKKVMQEMTPKYVTRLSIYRQNVLKTLEKAWLRAGRGAGELNEIDQHLDHSMARVLLSLTPLDGDTYAPEPLLCAWLLDYVWDELTAVEEGIAEVMIRNIENDSRIERKTVSMDVCCLIWRFRDTLVLSLHNQAAAAINAMSERPTDKAKLLESLPEGDMVDVRVLLDLMSKKRHQASMSKKRHQASMSKKCHQASRDTSEEPVIIVGLTAIHVTAWDWNAAKIKNFGRDQAPFVQAIILERKIAASFRKTLETTLIESASKIQTIGDDDTLVTLQKWTWWDELVLPGNTMDAHAMKNSMQGTDLKVEQWRVQQLLVLEEQDRSAINKMVTYVTSMPCAKASAAKTSSLSQDVLEGLITLLKSTHSMTEDVTEKVAPAIAQIGAEIPSVQKIPSVIEGKSKGKVSQDGLDPQTSGMEPVEQAHASSSGPLLSHAKPKPRPVLRRSLLAAEQPSPSTPIHDTSAEPFKETAASLACILDNDMDVIADVPNVPCPPAAGDSLSGTTFSTSSDDGSALIAQGMGSGDHGWYQPTPSQHSSNDGLVTCRVLSAAYPHSRPVTSSNSIMTVTTASSSKRPRETSITATHTKKKLRGVVLAMVAAALLGERTVSPLATMELLRKLPQLVPL
ncbi:hypothetical protein BD769DRAFT_1392420 [Suillus cothurnatus]|nr:hypothetical protein BD769DRAFT_1392420 [Suillus cothurnatus]